jgi:hypothetical protein
VLRSSLGTAMLFREAAESRASYFARARLTETASLALDYNRRCDNFISELADAFDSLCHRF